MKSASNKGLRITRIATAVSAMLLLGTMLSGCRDSENRTSFDEVRQTVDDDEKQTETQQPHQASSDEVKQTVTEDETQSKTQQPHQASSDEVKQTVAEYETQSKTQQPHQAFYDEAMLYVAEEGDPVTGKPYKIKADRSIQELRAANGSVTEVNPVTGEDAGENEWFYTLPKEYFTYELNYDGGNNAENSSLETFTETFHATLEDGQILMVKQEFAAPLFRQTSSDDVKLTVFGEGDILTGKPYKIRANRNLQELQADHGSVTAVNPVTGEKAGDKEWFYVFPKDCLTARELNHDGAGDSDNDSKANSQKAFTETFRATLPDGETLEVKQTFAVTDMLLNGGYLYIVGPNPYDDTYPFLMTSESDAVDLAYKARPRMTLSELRYLLAKTSVNDTVIPALALSSIEKFDATYGENIVYDYGWQVNAAGFRFSSLYGFGAVDAGALAKAARACDKDPVCSGMKKLPEKYISHNKNPCTFADDSKRLITCSFSHFKNEKGQKLGRQTLIVDAVVYHIPVLSYLPAGIIEDCKLAASEENDEETGRGSERNLAVLKAYVFLEFVAESESGTKSILKPLYASQNYDEEDTRYLESPLPMNIATSAFYQESLKEDPKRKYRLRIRSPCQIDADKLNKNMHLTVYGRRK